MCAIQRNRDNMTRASIVVFFLSLRLIFKIVSPRRFIDCAMRQFAVNRAVRQKLSAEAAVKHERPSKTLVSRLVHILFYFFFFKFLYGIRASPGAWRAVSCRTKRTFARVVLTSWNATEWCARAKSNVANFRVKCARARFGFPSTSAPPRQDIEIRSWAAWLKELFMTLLTCCTGYLNFNLWSCWIFNDTFAVDNPRPGVETSSWFITD